MKVYRCSACDAKIVNPCKFKRHVARQHMSASTAPVLIWREEHEKRKNPGVGKKERKLHPFLRPGYDRADPLGLRAEASQAKPSGSQASQAKPSGSQAPQAKPSGSQAPRVKPSGSQGPQVISSSHLDILIIKDDDDDLDLL